MFGLGFGEIVVILGVALIFFGPDKLPEVARTLGRTVADLRRAMDDIKFEMAAPRKELEAELRSVREAAQGVELLPNQPLVGLPDSAVIAAAESSSGSELVATATAEVTGDPDKKSGSEYGN